MAADPIARWHDYVDSRDPARLDTMIADHAVFMSPAVHRPQQGKALTVKYLTAALAVLGGPDFRYLGEWRSEGSAILEFETVLDGIYVNGIDMIGWDADGLITSFKVMVRPLKGLNHVVELMGRALSQG